MLRHRLFMILGWLLLLLLGTAGGAIWSLQRMLAKIHPDNPLVVRFRILVLILSLAFVVALNILIVVLIQTAGRIVNPVEELIDGTRELAQEHFNHRVNIEQNDEFGELARAYNDMASKLQASEAHKLETLGQVALTLNHELNNAAATIELQLELLRKKSGNDQQADKYARQIRAGLARMSSTVDALKRVRRIVLTDYVAGVKMLDLEQSVRDIEHADDRVLPTGCN